MLSQMRLVPAPPGLIVLGVILVLLACAAGCTQQTQVSPTTTTVTAGMPNPASVYCGKAGGTVEIRKDTGGGEYGMCRFENGTACEEWALYRGEGCKAGAVATATTAGAEGKMVTFTNADNGKTAEVARGTTFAVQLAENPTTGFQWNATLSQGLTLVSDTNQTSAHAEGMVGVGGNRTWVVLAKDTGAQRFSAIYRRPWEPLTGNETTFAMNITIITG